jgi:hypothetical protein
LGAYDDIANYRGGKAGRASSFSLGIEVANNGTTRVCHTFVNDSGQPKMALFELWAAGHSLRIERKKGTAEWRISENGHATKDLRFPEFVSFELLNAFRVHSFEREVWSKVLETFGFPFRHSVPFASAPIRAEPRRTYELTSDIPEPQGSHVPVILSQIHRSKEWAEWHFRSQALLRS